MDTISHLQVIEIGGCVASICCHYLADLGADVIKIEPPEGDPDRFEPPFAGDITEGERSLRFLHLNANKRSIVLDLESDEDRLVFRQLVARADILIENQPPGYLDRLGLGYNQLREINSRLVMVSLSPFGQTGPFHSFKGNNAVAEAMSGFLYTMGNEEDPPIVSPSDFLSHVAGLHAGYYALAAVHYRHVGGRGQHIDVSLQEVGIQMATGLSEFSLRHNFRRRPRLGNVATATSAYVLEAKNGYVLTQPVTDRMWRAYADWMQNPLLLQREWESLDFRQENVDVIEMAAIEFARQFTVEEFVDGGQIRKIPTGPINPPEAFVESEQARELGSFVEFDHPVIGRYRSIRPPFRMSESSHQFRRPAPLLGEHQKEVVDELQSREPTKRARTGGKPAHSRGPLSDIRILDFTRVLAGPTATMLLSFLGAEVIKVESAEMPIPDRERGPIFADLNRGKKSITVDTRTPAGRDLVLSLASKCDVVIENFSAHVMKRLGLDYESLRRIRPDIIAISMPGFGRTGPLNEWGAYGPIIQAYSGVYWMWRHANSPIEAGIRGAPLDFYSAANAALTTLAALEYRGRTGKGQFIDLVMLEAGAHLLGPSYLDYLINGRRQEPRGYQSHRYAPHGCYPCQGYDSWCVIACETEDEWKALVCAMGEPPWTTTDKFATKAARVEGGAALDQLIEGWTKQYTPRQVMHILQNVGVPAGMVQNGEDLYHDYHLRARGYIVSVSNPAPWGTFEQFGPSGRLSDTPGDATSPTPSLGQHNEDIFIGILGMPKETVLRLHDEKVLH